MFMVFFFFLGLGFILQGGIFVLLGNHSMGWEKGPRVFSSFVSLTEDNGGRRKLPAPINRDKPQCKHKRFSL